MVAGDSPGTRTVSPPIHARSREREPVSLAEAMAAIGPVDTVWTGPDEPTVVTAGRVDTITAGGEGRFQGIRQQAETLFDRLAADVPDPARPRLFGGFAFFGTERLTAPWESFDPAAFHLPAIQVTITDSATWITVVGPASERAQDHLQARLDAVERDLETAGETRLAQDRESGNGHRATVTNESLREDRNAWVAGVRRITDTIEASGLQKAVLAQALDLEIAGRFDLPGVVRALGASYPGCYRFGFHDGAPDTSTAVAGETDTGRANSSNRDHEFFFGASPEKLVAKTGSTVTTEALAGTVERGATAAAEQAHERQLLTDPKLREEHDLVVDRIREQLDSIGSSVSVGDRSVRKLATVQHLHSPLSATVDPDRHVLEVVEALHPTPAVGGMPPDAAEAVIRDSESIERGWYAAPVGWFDATGDGTFAVGIRSALAAGDRATLFAGNGIVADSDPATEWDEVQLKFRPIRSALR